MLSQVKKILTNLLHNKHLLFQNFTISLYKQKQKAGMNEWVLVGDLLTYLNLTAHINTEHKQAAYQLSNDLSKMLIDGGNSKF
jgi:hypothetical protein